MDVTRLVLKNWRNFRDVDVNLTRRTFLVGPNASGKSNLLDVFRFLHDIVRVGGGLAEAVRSRGGMKSLRCLAAAGMPAGVQVTVEVQGESARWSYQLGFKAGAGKLSKFPVLITHEIVLRDGEKLLDRSEEVGDDSTDPELRTQTELQQTAKNSSFRELRDFFDSIRYLHLVPQLIKHPQAFSGANLRGDPFGLDFLETMARTPEGTRKARLKRIEDSLRAAVPQLKALSMEKDHAGVPHLRATYEHWRHHGAGQLETDFSDGTLRLIGLLWSLIDGVGPLLLEEPELSLHAAVVERLAPLIHRVQRKQGRQVIISTHSAGLLDNGVALEELLLLRPDAQKGTQVMPAGSEADAEALLNAGIPLGSIAIQRTRAQRSKDLDGQMSLFN